MKKTLDVAAIVLASLFLLVLAVVSLLGMIDPQKASVGYGNFGCRRRFVLPCVCLAQSRPCRIGRCFPPPAAMDGAGDSRVADLNLGGVRYDGSVAQRRDPTRLSRRHAGCHPHHHYAALAAGSRDQD